MKLRDLKGHFIRVRQVPVNPNEFVDGVMSPSGIRTYLDTVESLADAHGIWFNCPCPKCQTQGAYANVVLIGFAGRGYPVGTLSIGSNGQDTAWNVAGTGLDDLQLTPSIQIHGSCQWHGFVGSSGVPPGEAR